MSITNITTTADNGVERITNNQQVTGTASAAGETIILDNSASYLETGTSSGSITITRCQVKLDADTGTGGDASAPLNQGGRTVSSTYLGFIDSNIIAGPYTSRHNIMVTELTRTNVIETDGTGELFVYTAIDSIVDTVLLHGINVWEIVSAPDTNFNVKVSGVNYGYLNWEAGRLDFFGFAVENINTASFWMGTGNSGNNHDYHWNPDSSVNFQELYLTSANNRVYKGNTLTWEWHDQISSAAVQDALLIYRDNRSGTSAEKGRFTTNSNGRLAGTFDSQNDTTGSNIERPTLFVLTDQITNVSTGNPGTYDYPTTVIGGDQGNRQYNYDIDAVTIELEIRSYDHQPVSGFGPNDTYSPSGEVGSIGSDLSVSRYSEFLLTPDDGITATKSTALAYSGLKNLDELYDRIKAEWRDNDNYAVATKDGIKVDLGAYNLVLDGNNATTYAYSANIITVDTSTTGNVNMSAGTKFSTIKSTGTITVQDGATIDGLTIDGDVELNTASDLDGVVINGDLNINISANTILDFTDVTITGNVYNDATGNTLTINATNSSLAAGDSGTGNGQTDVQNTVPIKIIVKDVVDNTALIGARVYLEASSGGDLATGTEIINELTDVNGEVNDTFNYTNDQPVVGKVRKGTL